ncbi:MAG: hypothetical protein ACK5MT_20005 [Actinomycetales bacterium]
MNLIPIMAARQPIAIFRALRTRDGVARQHHGEPLFAVHSLPSSGEDVVEVRFADGLWMLCSPDDVLPGFTLDGYPGHVWLAHHYEDARNGWVAPVVERRVLEDLLAVTGEEHTWCASMLHLPSTPQPLRSTAGLYNLGQLALRFKVPI